MKAAANGVLNCSILDGWWVEGYAPDLGWAIGRGETYTDHNVQDQLESQALYDLLEKQIVPALLQAGRRQHSARLDRPHEKLHAQARPGLQHQPDGAGIHGEVLSSPPTSAAAPSPPTAYNAPSPSPISRTNFANAGAASEIVGVHSSGNGHYHVGDDMTGRSPGRSARHRSQRHHRPALRRPDHRHRRDRRGPGPQHGPLQGDRQQSPHVQRHHRLQSQRPPRLRRKGSPR